MATTSLAPTTDGSNIISRLRKNTFTHLTNFVISMANIHAYDMLATLDTHIKIKLPITITGYHHQQIVHIQLNPQNKNILGKASANLYQNPLTQNINPFTPIPRMRPTKGLTSRRSEKMAWARIILQDAYIIR